MLAILGPTPFPAQVTRDAAPFVSRDDITNWATDCSDGNVRVPGRNALPFALERATASKGNCAGFTGSTRAKSAALIELSLHPQGQLAATHPARDSRFDAFASPAGCRYPEAQPAGAVDQEK